MRKTTKVIGGAAGGILALGLVIGACSNGYGNSASSHSAPAASVQHTPKTSAAAPAASTKPPQPKKSSAPAMTVSQQQAVESAKGYLSLGTGFSKAGLLEQLTSSAGEGFSKADAKFAINYLHPNWYKQAVESAKGYLSTGGFSRAGLIEQLESSAGEGFTHAQAVYAVNKVGL